MKYLISISLLTIYLFGTLQSSWVLIDFYWNRDDYTQKYCLFLDEGITQCGASCYLDKLLAEKEKEGSDAQIISNQKIKIVELSSSNEQDFSFLSTIQIQQQAYLAGQYHFDFHQLIFHPPKV